VLQTVTLSMWPKDDGTVEGVGVSRYHLYTSDEQPGRCISYLAPPDVSWPVTVTGRFTDNVLSFEVEPATQTITLSPTGTCGGDSFEYETSHFGGWADITFTDGVYEWTMETPHNPPDTGRTYVEMKLRQKKPEGVLE
jgi:hypothetical protein